MESRHIQELKLTKEGMSLSEESEVTIKVQRSRWIVLAIYIAYAAINAMQWFEYSVIANIVTKYYSVDSLAVDWTSIIYMALYMPMVIPASYFIEKKVRKTHKLQSY